MREKHDGKRSSASEPETESRHLGGMTGIQRHDLKRHVRCIEALEAKICELRVDIEAEYLAAQMAGFAPEIMRKVIKRRRRDQAELLAEESLLETYYQALGIDFTPLGAWAATGDEGDWSERDRLNFQLDIEDAIRRLGSAAEFPAQELVMVKPSSRDKRSKCGARGMSVEVPA